jgi:phosphoribosylformylglycinamidine cyclo-ligase
LSKPNDLHAAQSYRNSGVDIEAGDELVEWLEKNQKNKLYSDRLISGIGGFASLFRIGFPEMKKPCLITCTDGVGTKVKLASHFEVYEGIGQDCVAMCVNDLICTGGKPLLFLDYYATGQLDLTAAKKFLIGVKNACEESLCLLVGGETAEMPGVYQTKDFDCAGFAVGIVDEEKTLGPQRVKAGDRLIGLASSGFHSNGYSLLRKIFAQDLKDWQEQLLEPTRLYVQVMKDLMAEVEIHAAAHITGGGIENIPRVLPEHLHWQARYWEFPEIFKEVQRRTKMSDDEMRTTLNCGVGFVLIVPEKAVASAQEIIKRHGIQTYDLGVLTEK